MNTKVQKNSDYTKTENPPCLAILEIKDVRKNDIGSCIGNLINTLIHYGWQFENYGIGSDIEFQAIGYFVKNECSISEYQKFCFFKLYSVLTDAKILYENNLITYSELHDIALRVRKDTQKRFTRIKNTHSKKELKNKNLDSDSLLILKAKLAILENEN